LRARNSAKCDCGRGFALDLAGGAYSASPDSLAGRGRGNGEKGNGEGQGGEGRGS